MGEKDDGLSLSLSLKCLENPDPTTLLNPPELSRHNKSSLLDPLQLPSETRSHFPEIDVNLPPAPAPAPEVEVSSPNSTVSSVSGKRSEIGEDYAGAGTGTGDEEEGAGGEAARKKLRLTREEAAVLEKAFKENSTLNPKQKVALASQLNLRPRQVEVWFQNRRARTKLKQTEVDCEYLRRCCEHLTEENRRLQKEVNELRALRHSSQSYTHANPPTTLSMCPSCERVAVLPTSSPATNSTLDILHHLKSANPQSHQRAPNVNVIWPFNTNGAPAT